MEMLGITRKAKSQVFQPQNARRCLPQQLLYHRHMIIISNTKTHQLNSVALVRERTIPTERPPPVGEVSINFCG